MTKIPIDEDLVNKAIALIDSTIKEKEEDFTSYSRRLCWVEILRGQGIEIYNLRSFRHKLTIQMIEEKQKGYLPSSWYERKEIR